MYIAVRLGAVSVLYNLLINTNVDLIIVGCFWLVLRSPLTESRHGYVATMKVGFRATGTWDYVGAQSVGGYRQSLTESRVYK
jgi:hypothetical protein